MRTAPSRRGSAGGHVSFTEWTSGGKRRPLLTYAVPAGAQDLRNSGTRFVRLTGDGPWELDKPSAITAFTLRGSPMSLHPASPSGMTARCPVLHESTCFEKSTDFSPGYAYAMALLPSAAAHWRKDSNNCGVAFAVVSRKARMEPTMMNVFHRQPRRNSSSACFL